MFIDHLKIEVLAGSGGDGCVSFSREKYRPQGGPNGGDGGHGGSIILIANDNMSTLLDLKYRPQVKGERGRHGTGNNRTGRSASHFYVKVPMGTLIKNADTGEVIADLTENHQEAIVATAGRGGKGNARFATHQNKAPTLYEKGEPGEALTLELELKLLADVGLVGLPNAGKSTLISCISNARPKIANYPFTTLIPNLGVVRMGMAEHFVMADIPGIIAGAHNGIGLGNEFLRHIDRTAVLLHLIDLSGLDGDAPQDAFETIQGELIESVQHLDQKPRLIVFTKCDLPEAQENLPEMIAFIEAKGLKHLTISSATTLGLDTLKQIAYTMLKDERKRQKEEAARCAIRLGDKPKIVRLKKSANRFKIYQNDDGVFSVDGDEVRKWVAMTDFACESAIKRLDKILQRMGVISALKKRYLVQEGDTVFIAGQELIFSSEEEIS